MVCLDAISASMIERGPSADRCRHVRRIQQWRGGTARGKHFLTAEHALVCSAGIHHVEYFELVGNEFIVGHHIADPLSATSIMPTVTWVGRSFAMDDSLIFGILCHSRVYQYRAERYFQSSHHSIGGGNSANADREHVRHEFPQHARIGLALGLPLRAGAHCGKHAVADPMV